MVKTIGVNPLRCPAGTTMARSMTYRAQVELLILGAGWTSTFLIPLLETNKISFAATSRDGREGTIPFNFDPLSDNVEQYKSLPDATTVLITFPVVKNVQSLVDGYNETRNGAGSNRSVNWIQLGSTGSFVRVRILCSTLSLTRCLHGRVNRLRVGRIGARISNLFPEAFRRQNYSSIRLQPSCTLLGSGGERGIRPTGLRGLRQTRTLSPRRSVCILSYDLLISRRNVLLKGSLHLVHGEDVARAILAAHRNFDKLAGQRWCLTDLRVYDWWELVSSWNASAQNGKCDVTENPRLWVKQLMGERSIRALPRPMELLGQTLDSREFWEVVGIIPGVTLHSAVAYLA